MSDKIYCGNAKAIETKYGEIMKVSFSRSDIEKLNQNLNEKGYVNLNITERREADKYGNTHSVVIDTWKP
jgi:outer membrane protein assembly factor BamA